MGQRDQKIDEIVKFVRSHPGSFASRAVIRRFMGSDYELGDELFYNLQCRLKTSDVNETEIDLCYDLIK